MRIGIHTYTHTVVEDGGGRRKYGRSNNRILPLTYPILFAGVTGGAAVGTGECVALARRFSCAFF